jgi:NADH:ubiquinone oxidoreductase subunit 6 (subunit J)
MEDLRAKSNTNPIMALTLLLGTVLFGSVVFVLLKWHDIDALSYAVLGAAVGWCAGMLIAPYPDEVERFAKFSKTVSAFVTGYLVSKVETVWGFITSEQHRGIFFDQTIQRRFVIGSTCFFLVGAAVFKSRSYLRKPLLRPEEPSLDPHL